MSKVTASDLPFAVPPGGLIQDELNAREQEPSDLASAIGLSEVEVASLIAGGHPIDRALALKLETFFGASAGFWMNLEDSYREALSAGTPKLSEEAIVERQKKARGEASGNVALRLPKSLHGRVRDLADREGVSMNQLLLSIITEGVAAGEAR